MVLPHTPVTYGGKTPDALLGETRQMALSEEPQRQIPTEGNPPAVLAPQRTGSPRPHWLPLVPLSP
ncbi:MAG: hypothetical protein HC773_16320 [Scytonema sp. CRU_2_7]|nr:hypothetical protein [Scytonema sp. CRU_2_7]